MAIRSLRPLRLVSKPAQLWIGCTVALLLHCLPVPLAAEKPDYLETHYASVDQTLAAVFPGAEIQAQTRTVTPQDRTKLEQKLGYHIPEKAFTFYIAASQQKRIGYAVVLDEIGKHFPMTFLVAVTPDHHVRDVTLLTYRERIGADVRKPRFMRQFIDKTASNPLQVKNDIQGITGATISSWAISAGVKKALIITEYFYP